MDYVARPLEEARRAEVEIGTWFHQMGRLAELHRLADAHAHDWVRHHTTYHWHFGAQLLDPDKDSCLCRRLLHAVSLCEQAIRQELIGQIVETVTTLPPSEQELFLTYYVSGKSAAEIAARLQIRGPLIWQRLVRLRRRIKSHLTDAGWEEN